MKREPTTAPCIYSPHASFRPCILIFDSLQTGSRAKVAATLRDWLKCEYKTKMPDGQTREFTKDNMRGCCPKVPQQPNFSDCGVFLLQYIESFFEVMSGLMSANFFSRTNITHIPFGCRTRCQITRYPLHLCVVGSPRMW